MDAQLCSPHSWPQYIPTDATAPHRRRGSRMNSSHHIRFYKPGDRLALEDLYQDVYGEAWRDNTRLGWYIDQPLAEAGSAVAVTGDKIVAAQPFCDFPLHTPWGVMRA